MWRCVSVCSPIFPSGDYCWLKIGCPSLLCTIFPSSSPFSHPLRQRLRRPRGEERCANGECFSTSFFSAHSTQPTPTPLDQLCTTYVVLLPCIFHVMRFTNGEAALRRAHLHPQTQTNPCIPGVLLRPTRMLVVAGQRVPLEQGCGAASVPLCTQDKFICSIFPVLKM